jgi:hypothetical protein
MTRVFGEPFLNNRSNLYSSISSGTTCNYANEPANAHGTKRSSSAMAIGATLQPETCDKLKSIERKSKSGKLAKQHLGLSEEAAHIAAINTAILDATYQRASGWQRIVAGE